MAAPVISDRRARRKRGSVWSWLARRFGALVVTLLALGSVSWVSPLLGGAPPRLLAANPPAAIEAALPPKLLGVAKPSDKPGWIDLAQAAAPVRHGRRGISLNVRGIAREDGFEVLNAAELDAISQAH